MLSLKKSARIDSEILTVSVAALGLGLIVVLGVGDGSLDQVLDVTLDVLPELQHVVPLGPHGPSHTVLCQLLTESVLIQLANVASLQAVVLADGIVYGIIIILNVSQL